MPSHRTPSLLLLLGILLLPQTVLAADTQRVFRQLDQSQDGQLTADEIRADHQRLFTRLLRIADQDQNGRLSSSEFAAGLTPQALEKPLVQKEGSELPGSDALLLLLSQMDANSNGTIEATEVPRQFREIFDRIEGQLGQADGILDRRELTQAAPRLSQVALRIANRLGLDVEVELALLSNAQWESVQNMLTPPRRGDFLSDPARAREFFERLDANGDGQIIAAEVPDALAERFERLLERADRNRDEQLGMQELLKFSAQLQNLTTNRLSPAEVKSGSKRLLKRFDRNRDEHLSRDEVPRRLANRFDEIDSNSDGQLERGELAPVVELLNRLRKSEPKRSDQVEAMMQPAE